MNKENTLIPALRFPEFVNEGEWEEKLLGEIAENLDSKRVPITSNQREKGDIPYYGASGIIDFVKGYIYNETLLCISEDGANLIDRNYPIAFSISGKTWVNNHAHVIKFENTSTQLLVEKYINSINIENFLTGMAQPKLNRGKLDIILIPLPKNLKEQQKIASCLSSLDEVIAAQSQKLELLKTHKKGLMQNLFPQEGETVPKLRFPEFENDEEWINSTVEKLIRENILFAPKDGNHGNLHPKSSDYVKSGIPFIMASDLQNGKINFPKCAYLKKEQADSLQKGFSKSGDVLLSHKGTVGEVVLLGELEFPYIMLTPQVTYYRINDKNKLSNAFLATFFTSSLFQDCLFNVSGGGTRAYVGITEQQKLKIVYPKNIEEQQKIASCLSSLDALITAQAEKIEQLKLHKKGLMQGLFPKINE